MGKSILWAHSSLESEPKEVNKGWLLRWTVSRLGILSALNSLSIVENYLHGSPLTTQKSVLASSPTTSHIFWVAPGGHVCVCVFMCMWVGMCLCVCVYTHLSKAWRNPLSSLKAREGRLPLQAAGGGRTKIYNHHGKDSPGLDLHSQPAFWSLYLTFMCAAVV